MASTRHRRPPIREPTVFDNNRKISSVLLSMSHETQISTYPRPESPRHEPPTIPSTQINPNPTSLRPTNHHDLPNFLDIPLFTAHTLPARPNPLKSRRDKILTPLDRLELELPGAIGLSGLGGVLESAHAAIHSDAHTLEEFMESPRTILLPTFDPLSQRELDRLERELFDLTKYSGGYSEFLTAATWSEGAEVGSVVLYTVLLARGEEGEGQVPVGIRPVAAMQGVPRGVLVAMRTEGRVRRKVVLVPDADTGGFRWTANPSRGPTYVGRGVEGQTTHSRDDARGFKATIPQFVALMHSNRAILEDVQTTCVARVQTEDGDVMPAVKLVKAPRPNSHAGNGVHVAVLMPNEAEWAEEQIYWIDEGGLTEFRRSKYWGLIEHGRRRIRSRSRSRHATRSRHGSPDGGRHKSQSRSRSRSDHRHSRSRSRHLSLNDIF